MEDSKLNWFSGLERLREKYLWRLWRKERVAKAMEEGLTDGGYGDL